MMLLCAATAATFVAGGGCRKEAEPAEEGPLCTQVPGSLPTDVPEGLSGMSEIPIQYVFVLMQENHSFDNYFGRFQDYLKFIAPKRPGDPRVQHGGIDVPCLPYDLLSAEQKKTEDRLLDSSYDPRSNAPFNPTHAGADPKCGEKHYWKHAKTDAQQCVSDTCHEWWCSHLAWDSGRMDGFFEGNDGFHEGGEPKPPSAAELKGDRAMWYYDQTNIPFYYWLAEQFGLGDRYFSSLLGPTFPNRDYLYGATSRGLVSNGSATYGDDTPVGCVDVATTFQFAKDQSADPKALNGNNTIYDAMKHGNVLWAQWVRIRYSNILASAKYGAWYGSGGLVGQRYYDGQAQQLAPAEWGFEKFIRNENDLIRSWIKGGNDPAAFKPKFDPNAPNAGGSPQATQVHFLDAGGLEDVNGEDEHPPGVPQMGQRFVYDVFRVLMENPEVWKRSVLFITYDEAGGFYDHVPPPRACTPDNIDPNYIGGAYGEGKFADHTDKKYGGHFDRYGFRVPFMVISPWTKPHYVSHNTYDHTSILRFLEGRFGLPALTRRDANADPLLDFFDFNGARDKLRGNMIGWGREGDQFPPKEGFPNTPSEEALSQKPPPTKYATVDDVRYYGLAKDNHAEKFNMQANATCLALYPPTSGVNHSEICNVLGANVYNSYTDSLGKPPPKNYDSQKSEPFPNQSSMSSTGTGGGAGSCGPKQLYAGGARLLAIDSKYLYIATHDGIWFKGMHPEAGLAKVPIGGGDAVKFASTPDGMIAVNNFALDGDTAYWAHQGVGVTKQAANPGAPPADILKGGIGSIAIYDKFIYYYQSDGLVHRAGLSGESPAGLINDSGGVSALTAAAAGVFYSGQVDVIRLGLDGSGNAPLINKTQYGGAPFQLLVYGGYLYARFGNGQLGSPVPSPKDHLVRAPVMGGTAQEIVFDEPMFDFAVDDSYAYYASFYWPATFDTPPPAKASIRRVATLGGSPETVVGDTIPPDGVRVDATSLYWGDDKGLWALPKP